MSRELPSKCRWCDRQFAGNRKFCSAECRLASQERQSSDPSPQEIREMCCQIREAGGDAWERTHTCYSLQPVQIRTVAASHCCLVALSD
ncbi:MAG: hypothetical protein HY290_20335 [Planctomycetia bacterium]|nr:hypothetical protein [Planctomycetia bacterium]